MAFFDDTAAARTERPTERRRRQARERGQVARSAELLAAARVAAVWIVLAWWFANFANFAATSLRDSIEQASQTLTQTTAAVSQLQELAARFVATASWPLLIATATILLAHFAQVGWLWRWENAAPQSSRLSLISGLQRMCSSSTLGRALISNCKLVFVIAVSGYVLAAFMSPPTPNPATNVSSHLTTFGRNAAQLVSSIAITLLTFGLLDYVWQRWRFERSLLMTHEELREELRDLAGHSRMKNQRHSALRQGSVALPANITADDHNDHIS